MVSLLRIDTQTANIVEVLDNIKRFEHNPISGQVIVHYVDSTTFTYTGDDARALRYAMVKLAENEARQIWANAGAPDV